MEGKYDIRCSFHSPNYDDFCFLKPWNKKRVNAVVQTSLEAQDSRDLTHLPWGAQWSSWQHPSRKLWKCSHISEKSKMCIIHARSSDSHTSPDLCRCLAFSQVIGLKTSLLIRHRQVSKCTFITRLGGPPAAYPGHAGTNDTQSVIHMNSSYTLTHIYHTYYTNSVKCKVIHANTPAFTFKTLDRCCQVFKHTLMLTFITFTQI